MTDCVSVGFGDEEYEGEWVPPCPSCGEPLNDFDGNCLDVTYTCEHCGSELIFLHSNEDDPDMDYGCKICPISKPNSPSALKEDSG